MLDVKNLHKKYKEKEVLKGVSFNLNEGDNVALLGSNGAGKTTLFRLMAGFEKPDIGEIITDLKFNTEVGMMPQEDILIDDLKVKELVNLKLNMCGVKKADVELMLSEVGLQDVSETFVSDLSGGQKRRLSFLISQSNRPKLLFLDEPTTGMDLQSVDQFWELMKGKNYTSMIITHDFNQIDNYFNRVLILKDGAIASDVKVSDIHNEGSSIEEFYRKIVIGG